MSGSSRSRILIEGAEENNLRDVTLGLPSGLTAIVGVSGSGKSSLAFDTLYHEARRRFLETLSLGSPWLRMRPARVRAIRGLGPAVAVAQNVLNRNPNSTVASATGIHPFLRVLYARFADHRCPDCGAETRTTSTEGQVATLRALSAGADGESIEVLAPLVRGAEGSHGRLLGWLRDVVGPDDLEVDGGRWDGRSLDPARRHDISVKVATVERTADAATVRRAIGAVDDLGVAQTLLRVDGTDRWLSRASLCPGCGRPFREPQPEDFRHRGEDWLAAHRLGGLSLPELLRLDVRAAKQAFGGLTSLGLPKLPVDHVVRRLDALEAVGLGYLTLDRASPSLSRGEAQRLRISLLLANPVEDLLHVLDEPTIGIDEHQVGGLLGQLARLRGPVVMVEHDRAAVARADQVVELGPGAGGDGGRVVFEGVPADLWRASTASGRRFAGRTARPTARQSAVESAPDGWLSVDRATANNLAGIDVSFPTGR